MEYSKTLSTWWSGIIYHKEQLDALVSSTDLKTCSYILHDKCFDDNGEPKKPHYHYVVRFPRNTRGSWFKQFTTDDMGKILFKPVTHPQGAYDYLIHDTDDCRKKNKRPYDPSERIGTITEFDNPDDKKQTNTEKFFIRLYEMASNMELQAEFPTLYAQYGVDKIEKFRQDYIKEKYGQDDRDVKVTYVYGETRFGKTTYVRDRHEKKDICRVTNYKTGTFENYNAHKVLVLDEFTGKLDIDFVNNLLDRLPLELPARYSNRTACFTDIYIISNLPMSEIYKDAPTEVRKAFVERFHDIVFFYEKYKHRYEMQNKMRVLSEAEQINMPF